MRTGCVQKPCEWEMPPSCCKGVCAPDDEILDELWEEVSEFIFHETCGRFPGRCPAETRPCAPCGCVMSCRCKDYRRIDLSEAFCYPIIRDDDGAPELDIVVDGVIVPAGSYRLEGDGIILATPTNLSPNPLGCTGYWPGQDLGLANGSQGTWSIRATIGQPPPRILLRGAGMLACELWKECHGQESCLPDGVKQIVRRGLTMEVGSGLEETINFETGGTGIEILDLALRRYGDCESEPVHAHIDPCEDDDPRSWHFVGVVPAGTVGSAP